MKTLKSRLRRQDAPGPPASNAAATAAAPSAQAADWNKYDDRLMKAAERGDVEKVSSILAKKGVNPGKLDVEGRSAFHVVASKGNLECLNAILIHGVDITSSDTAGRNALHLAAKYGHALCLQKLLQYNCPTEHVDLQGRTALHDAAMADCLSSIQLLCDHGASVNVKDVDGRTPLVLATQMCRPTICQLLIDRGADVNSRDKQNRTALMLGCEYGCRDAVDVLIKNGADVTLLDTLGNDSAYYARIGDNLDILTLLKNASENTHKGRETWKKGPSLQQRNLTHFLAEANMKSNQRDHQNTQELEVENEELKDRLRKIQQEQRILLDKVNGLQLQLNEEIMVADDLQREKEKLKSLLATKEKQQEESLRTIEALKNRFKCFEGDHLGSGIHFSNRKEDMLLKQGQMFPTDSQCAPPGMPGHPQSRSMLRPLELTLPNQASYSEHEMLRKELEAMRSFCESAKQDRLQLQNELAHKVAECKALALECERVKEDSDEQIRQLEDALKDVQKRMYESEGKVKQMQTHFLALKEHLTSEAASGNHKLVEDLREQVRDVKSKYEGASAEVGKLRNQVRQNEVLISELRREEGKLREENRQLQKDVGTCEVEQEKQRRRAAEGESQLQDLVAKLALSIPTEKFENMKSSLANEVNEKARKIAEMERECERAHCESRQLRRELENCKAKLAQQVPPEDHEQLRSVAERKSGELGKKVAELTLKNQTLQKDVEKFCLDNKLLSQQVHNLKADMKNHYVPLKVSEEMKRAHGTVVEDLNKKLADVTQKYTEKKLELEKLLVERDNLSKSVSHLETVLIPPEKHDQEMKALQASVAELTEQLSELNRKHGEDQETVDSLRSENAHLKTALSNQYVPAKTHEEVKGVLSHTLDKTNRELLEVKKKLEDMTQQCAGLRDKNETLSRNLEATQNRIRAEYVSLREHEAALGALRQCVKEAEGQSAALLSDYQQGQAQIATLHAEMEAQKRELDTIQECLRLKYAPIASLEESERKFKATERELRERLSEQTQRCREQEAAAKKREQERAALQGEVAGLQKELATQSLLVENLREAERASRQKAEELDSQFRDLSGQHAQAKQEQERLAGESARRAAELSAAQTRLQTQQAALAQAQSHRTALDGALEALREELRGAQRSSEKERQAAAQLRQLLESQKNASVPLAEHLQAKAALEQEVGLARASLREKEEESQSRTREVAKLQAEVQETRAALRKLETREVVDLSKYQATKGDLEAQVAGLTEKLASLNRKYEAACAEPGRPPAGGEREPPPSLEQELRDRRERCDRSLATIAELQRRIQDSAKQIEAKDNKITELLNDVERLRQALNGLSQLTYASGSPSRRQSQQVDSLQLQVKTLQQQLADADRQHQEVIAIYRTHLLSAAQGHMDEDVQAALLQIIQMRRGLVC